jgi:hypothetical protein
MNQNREYRSEFYKTVKSHLGHRWDRSVNLQGVLVEESNTNT